MGKLDSKISSAQIRVASIDDLLIEIFLRLPLKQLVRFKSVSKHWNSIISDPKFHILFNRKPNPPAGGLICNTNISDRFAYIVPFDKSTTPSFLEFPHQVPNQLRILHSCNGLLVCGNYDNRILLHGSIIGRCYVLNPTTMKATLLPGLDYEKPEEKIIGMFLAFDPSKSPHYKVVCVFQLSDLHILPRSFRLEVYSSKTGSWEKRGKPFTSFKVRMNTGVYWNGAIHWVRSFSKYEGSIYFNPDDDDDQMPRAMPMLPVDRTTHLKSGYNYFGESCDHLHYVDYCMTDCIVYEMKRDYSEWFVKYRVDLSCVLDFSVCTLVRGDKDSDSFLVFWEKRRFIRFNLVHKTFENLHEIDLHIRSMDICILSPCVLSSFLC